MPVLCMIATNGGMQMEHRAEVEIVLRELRARNAVLEAVQTQLMLRIASIFDQPQEFIRLVMMHAEENLRRGRDQATGEDQAVAQDAATVCDNYSMRLIAALTPKQNAQ